MDSPNEPPTPDARNDLIARFFDVNLSEAERAALASDLRHDPQTAAAFDRALRAEGLLHAAHAQAPDAALLTKRLQLRAEPPRKRRWSLNLAAAALLLGALGLGFWLYGQPPADGRVASAPVMPNGLRFAVFGTIESSYEGDTFRFRATQVLRPLAEQAPGSPLGHGTFAVRVNGAEFADDPRLSELLKQLQRGQYVTLAVETLEDGTLRLLQVPESIGPHYLGQCACRRVREPQTPARSKG
ncbi:MAG: hypothetical protein AMXMBFR7_18820 [Planctomycetota bacterium]